MNLFLMLFLLSVQLMSHSVSNTNVGYLQPILHLSDKFISNAWLIYLSWTATIHYLNWHPCVMYELEIKDVYPVVGLHCYYMQYIMVIYDLPIQTGFHWQQLSA